VGHYWLSVIHAGHGLAAPGVYRRPKVLDPGRI
jgi:hypothetical protein